jgi:Fe-S oxidoreductase
LGSGLSALTAAFELAKKGHKAVIFHLETLGGRLKNLSSDLLPPGVLEETFQTLKNLKVSFQQIQNYDKDWFEGLFDEFKAVFLSLDDETVDAESLGIPDIPADPVTGASTKPGVFLGEYSPDFPHIRAITSGKKAAASIDRIFLGVDPKTAREKELVTPSRLPVNLSERPSAAEVKAIDPLHPTAGEAQAEAKRCLSCTCLMCLPPCPFLRNRKGYPKKYAREFYNNIITAFGIRHSNRHINSCAQCGLCGQICPNGADLGKFVELARFDMVASNHMPASAHEYALEDQVFSNSPQAAFLRAEPGTDSSQYLFFPGCQLTASIPQAAKAVYHHLTEHLKGGVGLWASCCGAPGRWSGRKILTEKSTSALKTAWEGAGRPTIILACPSCRLFFLNELPSIPIISLWSVLESLPKPSGAKTLSEPLLIHDPCAARLDAQAQDSVRALMGAIGQDITEPKLTKRFTLCCGYGGLADQANPEMGRQYALERTSEAGGPLLAWCIMCRDRFLGVGSLAYHPLELLFADAENCGESIKTPTAPGLSERRENRSLFKNLMLSTVWSEKAEVPDMPLNIDIPGSVLADMESRKILISDVVLVLEDADKNGPMFVNPETKLSLACFRPRQVTFWVEYEDMPDGRKQVHRAWCHRMTLPNVPGEGQESPATQEGYARTGGRV